MSSEAWRQAAFEVYRIAQAELLKPWPGANDEQLEYYVQELREALLDLKEATLASDRQRALESMNEIAALLRELRIRFGGDS